MLTLLVVTSACRLARPTTCNPRCKPIDLVALFASVWPSLAWRKLAGQLVVGLAWLFGMALHGWLAGWPGLAWSGLAGPGLTELAWLLGQLAAGLAQLPVWSVMVWDHFW